MYKVSNKKKAGTLNPGVYIPEDTWKTDHSGVLYSATYAHLKCTTTVRNMPKGAACNLDEGGKVSVAFVETTIQALCVGHKNHLSTKATQVRCRGEFERTSGNLNPVFSNSCPRSNDMYSSRWGSVLCRKAKRT